MTTVLMIGTEEAYFRFLGFGLILMNGFFEDILALYREFSGHPKM